jgi:hypothetical protein
LTAAQHTHTTHCPLPQQKRPCIHPGKEEKKKKSFSFFFYSKKNKKEEEVA